MKKRATIFFFFDNDGIVDRYVGYMLDCLREVSEYIVVVCNGGLSIEGRKFLDEKADFVFCRKNIGLDTWAFKEAIEYVGWKKINEFDELILCNFTMFGPFRSLKDVFDEMESSTCDYWGITYVERKDTLAVVGGVPIPYGYRPESVTSNFRVIRAKLLHSYEFRNFWTTIPVTNTYWESAVYGEMVFTETMRRAGYTYEVYGRDYIRQCGSNTTEDTYIYLSSARAPFIRRRTFAHNYDLALHVGYGEDPKKSFEYIEKNTNYDISMITENILRTSGQNLYKERFCNNFIIPDDLSAKSYGEKKIAVVISFESDKYIDKLCSYAANMPAKTDVFAAVYSEELLENVQTAFSERITGKFTAAVNEYGSPAAAYLITFRNELSSNGYDYICFLNDSAVSSDNEKESEVLMYRCLLPICGSENIVSNVIEIFEENAFIGIISSNEIYHADHFVSTISKPDKHFNACTAIIEKFCDGVCFNADTLPSGCYGSEFWARPEVLKKLWECTETEEIFADAETAAAAEICYPFFAQSCGYLTANVITKSQAEHDLCNYQYMLNRFKKVYYSKNKTDARFSTVYKYYSDLCRMSKSSPVQISSARLYTDRDGSYSEKTALNGGRVVNGSIYTHTFVLTGREKNLRFDPVDNSACLVRMLSVESDAGPLAVKPINGFTKNNIMCFLNSDPQISIKLAGKSIKKLTITAEIFKFSDNIIYSIFESIRKSRDLITTYKMPLLTGTQSPSDAANAGKSVNEAVVLYINKGNGYNEKDKINIPYSACGSGIFEHEYSFSSTPKSVRFDPLNSECIVYGLEITSSVGRLEAKDLNGFRVSSASVFLTSDPQFEIIFPKNKRIKTLKIRAFIIPIRDRLLNEALSHCRANNLFSRNIKRLINHKPH